MNASVTRRLRSSSFPLLTLLALASACSGVSPSERPLRHSARVDTSASKPDPTTPTASSSAPQAPPSAEEVVQGRTILGPAVATNLPMSIEPLPADRAALFVTQGADERESFVRWIDDAGRLGPVLRLVDEYVVTAYVRSDGKQDLVTSDGEHLCITRHARNLAASEARACVAIAAKAVAVAQQKLAVISLEEHTVKVEKTAVTKVVRKSKPPAPKARASEKPPAKKKPSAPKKKTPPSKKKKPNSKPSVEKKIEIVRRDVDVLAAWGTSDGFGEAKKIGLKFVPPLDGMTIVDAKTTPRGVLLGWFEKSKPPPHAPKPNAKLPPALGWAAIHAGILDATGTFDAASNKVVVEGEYDWGYMRGFSGPRFVDGPGGPALLTQKNQRGGPCDLTKVGETATLGLPNAICSIDPSAGPGADMKVLETILGAAPKRRPGQPKYDPELVAWVGDTGYFVTNEGRTLHSAKRDGSMRDEPAPFTARRSRMTSAELHTDGSGWAIVDGQKIRLDASGAISMEEPSGKTMMQSAPGFDGQWAEVLALVRPGYRVIPRGSGGVIVVGISTSKDENVVALTIGPRGNVGVAALTSLKVAPGEFELHVAARPGGGCWVADPKRRHVIWLDDEVHETGSAGWPEGQSTAVCRDGAPGKQFVPSIVPGRFIEVPALVAPGICVVGEPAWAMDGSLRWFGTYARGMDVVPESRILRDLEKPPGPPAQSVEFAPEVVKRPKLRCPPEMVLVDGRLCVDRFEATIVDEETGQTLAPDFPVTPNLFEIAIGDWAMGRSRVGSVFARAMPLPFLPEWQRGKKIDVRAVPLPHVRPNGYLTGLIAETACSGAGKRLCTLAEFVLACRGEDDLQFPYGDTYIDGVCNVNRDVHPAALLHDNASIGHLDPRLNRVRVNGATLLQETADSPQCRSRWGSDAIYDMVGNLDEWVNEEGGAFAGGFYARSTRSGCEAVITAHPKNYLDYSTGVRCCQDATK